MADNTMLIVLLAAGAGAFYLMQSGKLPGMGGGAEEPAPIDPAAPATPATPATPVAPLPATIPPTTPINIYNINQRVARPPIVVRQVPRPTIPVVYTVGPSNRAIILQQLQPASIDLAYTRVAQYILYFHTGKKGPIDYRWITFARDRARLAVSKGHGSSKYHSKFADKFLEVAYRIQFAPTSREVEIISRDAANIFISLEQTDPQLLIRVS